MVIDAMTALKREVQRMQRELSRDVADNAARKHAEDQLDRLKTRFVRLQEEQLKPPAVPQRFNLLWVGVDLDGTLASPLWTPENPTSEIGDPLWDNVEKVRELVEEGYKVIIHTSRPWTDYEAIENWLNHYRIPFREIQCGKPLYAAYIDDRAINAEEESWLPR